jgi:hypothetical protein
MGVEAVAGSTAVQAATVALAEEVMGAAVAGIGKPQALGIIVA